MDRGRTAVRKLRLLTRRASQLAPAPYTVPPLRAWPHCPRWLAMPRWVLTCLPTPPATQVSFECAAPTTGEKLQLQGMNCFNAAAACAAISAAKRAAGEDGGFDWSEPAQQ